MLSTLSERLKQLKHYAHLMRFNRPIGILLLLWPTLWALWISAQGFPGYRISTIFIMGTLIMRSAGCIINDMTDRHIDPYVMRTQLRPLASGKVTLFEAWCLFVIMIAIALRLVLLLNTLTQCLAIAGLALTMIYPWLKRYTHFPQLGLGLAFAWGVPMAFAAQQGRVPLPAWILFIITLLWVVTYDTEYAMSDRDDDLKIGVKSTAILFGSYDYRIIGGLQVFLVLSFTLLGLWLKWSTCFYIGIGITALLFGYQQALLRSRETLQYLRAFHNNHWVGLCLFLSIALSYPLGPS